MAFVPPPLPVPLLLYPVTAYGISYDIFTRRTEDDTPNGWNARRNRTYSHIHQHLLASNFIRNQYSDFVNPLINVAAAYHTMWALENIPPPNKLSTTIKGLKLSRYDHLALLDITALIQLGGTVNSLRGPVPANLVPAGAVLVPPAVPIPPGVPFALPVDTRPGVGASNRANYLM
ncbi:hypothetical protein B0H12DRAFT_1053750 [Mycena haematopus]|nr:hypothetical protein B0H12DRAFT_1053750 [Mycena haematopus]